LSNGAHAILFVTSLLVTLGALWVLHAWATRVFPWLARRSRSLVAALVLLVLVDRGVDQIVIHLHDHTAGLVHAVLVLLMTTIVLAAAPVAILLGASWAIARRHEGRPAVVEPPPVSHVLPRVVTRRQVVEGIGGAAVFGATGSMLGWGMVRGRHAFELAEVPLRIPGLPRALDGYVIAQISDLHAGTFMGDRELDEGLAVVRRARPDLVVVTGDIVDFDPVYAAPTARRLTDLPARDGVTAILGNHDYYAGADDVIVALRAAGLKVLRNAGEVMRPGDGGGFALLGVDDLSSRRHGRDGPRLDVAAAGLPPDLPRILLSHQPVTVDLWAGQVAAQLSGHTHGGQINPGFSPVGLAMKYLAGTYLVGGTTLYVNRGFGTVGAPSRVGAPPEVTRFVLVAA
jgi:predicted MPP superfamily phosphohydrolase